MEENTAIRDDGVARVGGVLGTTGGEMREMVRELVVDGVRGSVWSEYSRMAQGRLEFLSSRGMKGFQALREMAIGRAASVI